MEYQQFNLSFMEKPFDSERLSESNNRTRKFYIKRNTVNHDIYENNHQFWNK